MYEKLTVSLGLDKKKFHEGLSEICNHIQGFQPEGQMNSLLQELTADKDAFFNNIYLASIRRGVQEESRKLNNCIANAQRYLDLLIGEAEGEVKASAALVRRQFGSYGKALIHMDVDSRLTAVDKLQSDLAKPVWQEHMARLPELAPRLDAMGVAKAALRQKRLEVDQANGGEVKPVSLVALKREAADCLTRLTTYAEAMAMTGDATSVELYSGLVEIITRVNATVRAGSKKAQADPAADATPATDATPAETPTVPLTA